MIYACESEVCVCLVRAIVPRITIDLIGNSRASFRSDDHDCLIALKSAHDRSSVLMSVHGTMGPCKYVFMGAHEHSLALMSGQELLKITNSSLFCQG